MLLVGPGEVVSDEMLRFLRGKVAGRIDAFCVPIDRLWPGWSDLDAMYLFAPPPERLAGVPTVKGLREWLTAAMRLSEQEHPATPEPAGDIP
jgi:hypothetical protein